MSCNAARDARTIHVPPDESSGAHFMSYEVKVSTERSRLPSVAALNDKLTSQGFQVRMSDGSWSDISGFWPATLLGRRCGFECFVDPIPAPRGVLGFLKRGSHDRVAVCGRFGASVLEQSVGLPVLATIRSMTGGGYGDDDERALTEAQQLAEARDVYVGAAIGVHACSRTEEADASDFPLLPWETADSRRELLGSLVSAGFLVAHRTGDVTQYRLNAQVRQSWMSTLQEMDQA